MKTRIDLINPNWQWTLRDAIRTERVIHIVGGANDIYLSQDQSGYTSMREHLEDALKAQGYEVTFFDPVYGMFDGVAPESSRQPLRDRDRSITVLANKLRSAFLDRNSGRGKRAFVVEDASLFCADNVHLTNEEHDAYSSIRYTMRRCPDGCSLFFMYDRETDIPQMLSAQTGLSKTILVPHPDQTQRRQFIVKVFPTLDEESREYLADISADLSLMKLQDIFKAVCKTNAHPTKNVLGKAIQTYITGYDDNPWKRLSKQKILTLEIELNKCVKGQREAVSFIVERLKDACTGVSAATEGRDAPRAKAVFAGLTGTGKTELAKQVARLVMGDESRLIVIACNEYKEPQSCQRLTGSPPGYVGYDDGGELTNAVQKNPFSIILCDEIEKADPSFWDYWLKVVEEGKLTDSHGNLTVFSNTVILFTTNLGAERASAEARTPGEAKRIIYEEIEKYFKSISRMEMFGRLKKHIIAFNPITEEVAKEIVQQHVKKISDNFFDEEQIRLCFSDKVVDRICSIAAKPSQYGARDVKNVVNSVLRASLCNIFLEIDINPGAEVEITDAVKQPDGTLKLAYNVKQPSLPHRGVSEPRPGGTFAGGNAATGDTFMTPAAGNDGTAGSTRRRRLSSTHGDSGGNGAGNGMGTPPRRRGFI